MNPRVRVVALMAILALPLSPLPALSLPPGLTTSDLIEEGKKMRLAGDYAGALEAYEEICRRVPPGPLGLYHGFGQHGLGQTYYDMKRYDDAIAHFDLALGVYTDEAVQRKARSLDMDVDFEALIARCFEGKAFAYADNKMDEKAIEMFEQADAHGGNNAADLRTLRDRIASKTAGEGERNRALEEARRAEEAGDVRKAFDNYMAAVNAVKDTNVDDIRKVLEMRAKLPNPPPVPEEARRHAVYAETAAKGAKTPEGYDAAITEYLTAIRLAPWWADLHVNASLLLEQRGRFGEAGAILEIYLLAAPNAPDTDKIKAKLYELEYKLRSAAR